MSTPASKVCKGCGRDLPLDAYRRQSASPTGRRARCVRCESAEAAARNLRPLPPIIAFQEAAGRAVDRRRDARRRAELVAAVDQAIEDAAPHTFNPSERDRRP
jgi:hypothetical protein